MDSALKKLGVYEFFTVFLAGIIAEVLVSITLDLCFHISLSLHENTLIFLLLGYFGGLLLHELSWKVKRPFKTTIKPFRNSFTGGTGIFTNSKDQEMAQRVKCYILKQDTSDVNTDEYVASVCCNDLQVNGQFDNAHGLQKESEFALSLSVAAGLLAGIVGIAMVIHNANQLEYEVCTAWGVIVLSLFLSVLFFFRSKRMHKYYLRCLIRTYAVAHELTFVRLEKEESNHDTSQESTPTSDHAHPGS